MSNIAFLATSLSIGGAERALVDLSNWLVKNGQHVDIILAKRGGEFEVLLNSNVNIKYLKIENRLVSLLFLIKKIYKYPNIIQHILFRGKPRVLRACRSLQALVQKEDYDVMVGTSELANLVCSFVVQSPLIKAKLILQQHTSFKKYILDSDNMLNKIFKNALCEKYRQADKIVCVSKGVETELITVLSSKNNKLVNTTTIYNSIADDKFNSSTNRSTSLCKILSMGRIVASKDHYTLLKAFKQISKEMNAELVIVGDGDEFSNIKKYAQKIGVEDKVTMPGRVINVQKYYSDANIFISTSTFEGFGSNLLEAMASCCQIVSTDCEFGPREILDNGRYGKLVGIGDVEGVYTAVLALKKNPVSSTALINRAKQFSTDTIGKQYLNLFDHI